MRSAVLLALVLATFGCGLHFHHPTFGEPGQDPTTAGGAGTSPPAPADDPDAGPPTGGSCDACVQAVCPAESQACDGADACTAILDCRAQCADQDCLDVCAETYGASPEADALDACVASGCGGLCP